MIKKAIQKIIGSVKIVTVLMLILALSSNGAFAAQRLFDNCDQIDKVEEVSKDEARLEQSLPSPDELPENMETSSKPNPEQMAYNAAPLLVKIDNSQSRYKLRQQEAQKLFKELIDNTEENSVISSSSKVTSCLGRQFTLVGAKPSGTS